MLSCRTCLVISANVLLILSNHSYPWVTNFSETSLSLHLCVVFRKDFIHMVSNYLNNTTIAIVFSNAFVLYFFVMLCTIILHHYTHYCFNLWFFKTNNVFDIVFSSTAVSKKRYELLLQPRLLSMFHITTKLSVAVVPLVKLYEQQHNCCHGPKHIVVMDLNIVLSWT